MASAVLAGDRRDVQPRAARHLLLYGLVVVLASWLAAALEPAGRWATLLDNIHWTTGYAVGAALAWIGAVHAGGVDRRVRAWFGIGLLALTIGQLFWNAQVYIGWNPFPGPSDVCFLLLAPAIAVGTWVAMRAYLPPSEHMVVALDVIGFGLAATVLALALYLPRSLEATLLQLAVMTLYPALLLATWAGMVVVWLHLRQRWTWRNLAVVTALLGHGACWMIWNVRTLENSLGSGTVLNVSFSLLSLLLGWGAAGWRYQPDRSPRFDRLCEGLLRQLPLTMTATASLTLGLLFLDRNVSEHARGPLLALGLMVLVLAVLRQTRQLGERERLLVAERGVAESRAQLQHMAHHDPMTGLPNLTLLRDRVEQALADAHRNSTHVALMFIDLDQFKEVNDSLGHVVGDKLLCHVASELLELLREGDTVSRQGGDEFIVVLRDIVHPRQATRVADALMRLSGKSVAIGGYDLLMSMSVGIAMYPEDGHDFASLQQSADTAMYKAKAAGRNTYRFYDAQMNCEAAERIRLRARMSRALENGEFSLHYQPQVDLASGVVLGAEALLRWNNPELGNIPPSVFIPIAEDSGQVVEIGAWVLSRACEDAARWPSLGLPALQISVNLSVLQMRRASVEQLVADVLRATGLAPGRLELEVTESVLLVDQDRVLATVQRLKELGVKIALDDFGTGYASLSHVKKLRPDKLKIDQSLIADGSVDTTDGNLILTAVDMARAMGMVSVAEGVETQAQRMFLGSIGCVQAQGYLFGRPMPLAEFERFVAGGSP